MKQLKTYLSLNSIFSALSGLIMLLLPTQLNELFNINNVYVFPIIGANLLVFSAIVWYVSRKHLTNKLMVKTISILDLLWVLGSLIIITFGLFNLSTNGYIIIGIVAIWIGFLAYKQNRQN